MDREADVIRAEMTETRAALDRKITMLESRARELTPREYARRHLPDYFTERVIGSVLVLIGARMAWKAYRRRPTRHERLRATINARAGW
jgi:hypothetical protein